MLSILPEDYWSTAAKAVRGYINRKFTGYFSELEVEDLVAVVVTRMWSGRESFDPSKGQEFSWIWTIAKNVVKDAAEAKHNRECVSGRWTADVDKSAAGMADGDSADTELLQDEFVESLLGRLRLERDRRILLYLAQEFDYEEIAKREDLSLNATYMAVFHMRERLERNNAA